MRLLSSDETVLPVFLWRYCARITGDASAQGSLQQGSFLQKQSGLNFLVLVQYPLWHMRAHKGLTGTAATPISVVKNGKIHCHRAHRQKR